MNKYFFIIIIAAVVVIVGLVVLRRGAPKETYNKVETPKVEIGTAEPAVEASIVVYGDVGYSPREIRVKQGDTVTFKNESSAAMWPATAIHPTHTVYPGSNIAKCATLDEETIFDACRGLGKGQEWSFRFNEKGTWQYHDHLNPGRSGTIIVE